MNSTELAQVVRNLVKEEVTKQVSKAMAKLMVEVVKEIRTPGNATAEPLSECVREKPQRPSVLTKNAKLNEALTDTLNSNNPLPRNPISFSEIMSDGFDKIGSAEQAYDSESSTNLGFLKHMVSESVTPAVQSVTDSNEISDELKNVFKRDYKELMKRIEEKRHGKK